MKRAKLAMLAILALGATQAAGCIISSDDDDDTVDNAVFNTAWTLSTANGPTSCDAQGADKVSFLFTAASTNMGTDEIFDCSALGGDTAPFAFDDYIYVATLLDCPDSTPGCPGGDNLGEVTLSTNTDTCDDISGSSCIVDLPVIDFVF